MFDAIADFFADLWDNTLDLLAYIFTFEWIGDIWEFFGTMVEGLGQFSFIGLAFGALTVMSSYGTKYLNLTGTDKQMTLVASMVQYMPPTQRIIWTVLSYLSCFIAGYLLGKHFENTG